jgi:hypothetical protein
MVTLSVTISDETYERLQQLAATTGQDLETVLANLPILTPTVLPEFDSTPVEALSDAEILKLAESKMNREQNQRMSELLQAQQARTLSEDERAELELLLGIYDAGNLRKAAALVEVTRRGLLR